MTFIILCQHSQFIVPNQFLTEDDNVTVATFNVSPYAVGSYMAHALSGLLQNKECAGAMFRLKNTAAAIADSCATQIVVMEGANIINKRCTMRPLNVTLAYGLQVVSTHMCDIHIDALPFVLTGHIIPDLSIASLFRI